MRTPVTMFFLDGWHCNTMVLPQNCNVKQIILAAKYFCWYTQTEMTVYDAPETGKRFGRLVVSFVSGGYAHGFRIGHCICDCGTEKDVPLYVLRRGASTSCGCYQKETAHNLAVNHPPAVTHGCARGGKQIPEYIVWAGMIQRCENPKHVSFNRYGGRGIAVCSEWKVFEKFLADMGPRPGRLFTVERMDNDGHYCKDNCRWATRREQSRNMSSCTWMTVNGRSMILADWASHCGITSAAMCHRLYSGWSMEEALTTKKGESRR